MNYEISIEFWSKQSSKQYVLLTTVWADTYGNSEIIGARGEIRNDSGYTLKNIRISVVDPVVTGLLVSPNMKPGEVYDFDTGDNYCDCWPGVPASPATAVAVGEVIE